MGLRYLLGHQRLSEDNYLPTYVLQLVGKQIIKLVLLDRIARINSWPGLTHLSRVRRRHNPLLRMPFRYTAYNSYRPILLNLLLLINYQGGEAIAIKAPWQDDAQTVGRPRSCMKLGLASFASEP